MFIILDESYNLKDRTKPQFISINGFKVVAVKRIWKTWKQTRRQFISKARIHATDKRFEALRKKSVSLLYSSSDVVVLTAFQDIKKIPSSKESPYYKKDKLIFNRVYEDLLKKLLDRLSLQEYKKVVIIIDSRKHKSGFLGKRQFRESVLEYLEQYYPNTVFRFDIVPSSSNILIEIADFISNSFYKKYIGQKMEILDKLKGKTIQTKNPLQ